jgi:hypothetical protein
MIMVHKKSAKRFDLVGSIMAYEGGELSDEDTIKLFQHLVDTGQVWSLQDSYGRQAMAMIEAGLVKPPKKETRDYYGNVIQFPKPAKRSD